MNVPEHIKNEEGWLRGREFAIKRNASKRRSREWLAVQGNQRLQDWLNQTGEFAITCACGRTNQEHQSPYGYQATEDCRHIVHPAVRGMYEGDFGAMLLNLRNALEEWGSLTPRQTEIAANSLARAEKRIAEFAAKRVAERAAQANSQHIGVVGERREFALTVDRVLSFDGTYGMSYINICHDADNNVIVYKGSKGWERGDTLRVKATVKEHSVRDDIAQTLIQRPTIL
jgi:hypothetical protein